MVQSSDDPDAHRKPCTLCHTPRDVLIRCQVDDSGKWHLICTGKCWKDVSGGVEDGDAHHPLYRYGGMWKNRWANVTAKKPKKVKDKQKFISQPPPWVPSGRKYTKNDKVTYQGKVWICRKSHTSMDDDVAYGESHGLWKEDEREESASADEATGSTVETRT